MDFILLLDLKYLRTIRSVLSNVCIYSFLEKCVPFRNTFYRPSFALGGLISLSVSHVYKATIDVICCNRILFVRSVAKYAILHYKMCVSTKSF